MPRLVNRAKMTTFTTGTGTLTLGSAVNGFQTFAAAGVNDGNVVHYVIEDGASWEIGSGTYTSAVDPDSFLVSSYLSRNVIESSASGALLNLSGSAVVYISALATDVETNTTISRAFMVSAIAEGFVPEDGNSYLLDGLVYIGTTGATAIPDLPGLFPAKPVSVLHFGADGSGATDATAAVTAANAYAVATDSSVVIAGGTFATTSAINFTAPVVFESGGVLKPTSTVTFTATLEAGNWQIFDLSNGGSIVASGRVVQVNALWWGMSQAADTATATANANAINNALKTRRPVVIPTTSPDRSTGWPVLSGTIIITDADTAISGAPGAKTLLNQYGTGHLFTIRASYHTCEWIEVRGDRDTTGDTLVNNLTDGFPWFLDTATQPIIQQINIRDCRTYNTWGVAADAKSGTAGNVPKQWFISDIEADLLRGPGFDMADVNGSLFLDNIGIGRGTSSRRLTTVADAGGGDVVFTTRDPHGFVAGNSVGIAGTTNYNGAATIVATPTPWTFTITAAYVAETLSGATASSFVAWFDHPALDLANNAGSNFRNCNFLGTSEDAVVSGTLISYPNQHGMDLDNVVSASFDGIYCDHCGGVAFRADSSYNLKGTRMHLGYAGSTNMHLLAVTRSRFHVEWLRGIPAASGGAPNIDGILMNSGCQDVTVYGGSALNITGHAFNIAGDRCSVFDWSLENITGDGLRYSAAATGISENLRFRNAPTSGVYARNLGSDTRVLNVERDTGTFADLCHVGTLTTAGTGSRAFAGPVGVGQYTVAGKPAASTFAGHVIYLTNESGGATLAYSDGTNWRRVYDNAVAS